jgi:ankyrin repeat protein
VNATAVFVWTPLHYAARFGHKEITELLIAAGTDVNAKDEGEFTPLHWAGTKEIVELLIAAGADVNVKDEYGGTPLASAVETKEIVELLIAAGADVNAKDKDDMTPLHEAASWGHKDVVELLIANGADLNARDWSGETPLDWAEETNNKEIAELLRKHGGKTGEELALMPPRLVQHGRFAFSFDAKEGKVYEVQDSFDLLNWEPIRTYTGAGDTVWFDEDRDHDPPQWFYRVKMVE